MAPEKLIKMVMDAKDVSRSVAIKRLTKCSDYIVVGYSRTETELMRLCGLEMDHIIDIGQIEWRKIK